MEASALAHGAAGRLAAHRRPSRHDPLLSQGEANHGWNLIQGLEIKDVDQFIKGDGSIPSREKEIGQHIGYRYDVNLVPDYDRLTPFLKQYMEIMGWDDLNWLEDVHMGYEEGRPAVFDRNINGWVTVPEDIELPDNQQDRDMIARELLIKFQMRACNRVL